jgi:hypothetical protein
VHPAGHIHTHSKLIRVLAVALVTVADALRRHSVARSIRATFEAGPLVLAATIFFEMPYASFPDGYISAQGRTTIPLRIPIFPCLAFSTAQDCY